MCGRFVGFRKYEELAKHFPIDASVCSVSASYNIAPSQEVLVIHRQEEKNVLDRFHWGMVPFWAKDKSMGARMINARAETLATKPSFKHAFKRQRCLIPADGFYEWSGPKGRKQPYFFTLAEKTPFAFAGIWDSWHSMEDPGEVYRSCAIITTEASPSVRKIHHRMPAILSPDAYGGWLNLHNQDLDLLTETLSRQIVTDLESCPVSTRVNQAGADGQANMAPLKQMKLDFEAGGDA